MHLLGLGGQMVKNLLWLACKFHFYQSERKSSQVHARPGQTESQVDPSFQFAGALLRVLDFSSPEFFFGRFRLFPVPTNCPWVSEDELLKNVREVLTTSSEPFNNARDWLEILWKSLARPVLKPSNIFLHLRLSLGSCATMSNNPSFGTWNHVKYLILGFHVT